uniref:Uncharacterized protein n=1 Tax=Ananas comosus var. bracteatus TaxID=296719 RepID=A0A6V7P4R1_ANACO|nr:unnamed protein product [Ananas comosus var. bracteatus]
MGIDESVVGGAASGGSAAGGAASRGPAAGGAASGGSAAGGAASRGPAAGGAASGGSAAGGGASKVSAAGGAASSRGRQRAFERLRSERLRATEGGELGGGSRAEKLLSPMWLVFQPSRWTLWRRQQRSARSGRPLVVGVSEERR